MKLFPYWWSAPSRDKAKPFIFSNFVVARHALVSAAISDSATPIHCDNVRLSDLKPEKALEWLYQLLSVLDTKASALMRLNGVMLAAALFLLNAHNGPNAAAALLAIGSGIGSALSIACCLLVVSVDWRFLALVQIGNNADKTQKTVDFSDELFHLQRVAESRQGWYRTGWVISLFTTAALLIAITIFFVSLTMFYL